ncbi:MAG: response regulator [Treponema sp.]|jgi:PAS domain S-box-containing protein|nr:response regulator [Treponema sp.]
MKWFENIKIRNKLFIVFGILVFIMISFAVFAVTRIVIIGNHYNELINTHQSRQIHITNAIADAYGLRVLNLSKGYLLEDDHFKDVVIRILENYGESSDSFIENLNKYRTGMLADPGLSESEKRQRLAMVNGIEETFARYAKITSKLEDAVANNDKQEVLLIFEEAIPVGNELIDKTQDFRDLVFYTTRLKSAQTMDDTANTVIIILAVTVVFFFLSAFILLFTFSSINRPLLKLEKAVKEIASGNLACAVRIERKDELGMLANCIGDMVDKISEHNKTMAIMDNLDSMICVCDLDYNLLYMNKHLADTFDLDREKCLGQKCYKTTKNKDAPCEFCQLAELLPQKDSFPSQYYEYQWDDSLNMWVGGSASIIRWVDGSMVFFRSARDETQKKQQEEMLEDALETAKTASTAKSSFLANMSHEIRTPMNAIMGTAEIKLRDDDLAPGIREALNMIYNSGDLLLSIINDILDLSKIEAGRLELSSNNYEVASMINDTVTLNMMRIGSKPIEFVLNVDENTPSVLFGDELRLKQILNNLLSNAFKYTKKGMVRLSVSAEIGDEENITIVFTVDDTGQGMSDEQVARLFDEYSRFNIQANRTTEGTGLGMSITRNLIQMMNGVISVKSEVDQGSVFTVRLPQKSTGSGVLGRDLAESLQKFRVSSAKQIQRAQLVYDPMPYGKVLIVDDVESNLYVAKGLMTPYELSIETARSGFDALDIIKGGNVYDIVFMDHMMPKMDGMETVKLIRKWGYTHPIVALTADAVIGQSDIFLANGFDGFISKPIDIRQLNAALKKYVRDKQPPEVIEAANRERQAKKAAAGEAPLATQPASTPMATMPASTPMATDPQLAEIFVRDANSAIITLESVYKKDSAEDIRLFTINVHAMKSALANIGEKELSAFALSLEQAGREKNTAVMSAETPAFLAQLRSTIEKLNSQKAVEPEDSETMDESAAAFLREKLITVKEACETYDKKTAKAAIAELKAKTWPRQIREQLDKMAEHLLNGDYDELARVAEKL